MDNIPTLEHNGFMYTGQYCVVGPTITVFHHNVSKQATLGGLQAAHFARQLLFEIVVRERRGIPDPK